MKGREKVNEYRRQFLSASDREGAGAIILFNPSDPPVTISYFINRPLYLQHWVVSSVSMGSLLPPTWTHGIYHYPPASAQGLQNVTQLEFEALTTDVKEKPQ